ncbi:hypothetical protein ABIE45_006282 [Methylobacterium sp. OAE515]
MRNRENVVIVETHPAHEAVWLSEIRKRAPADIALALATTAEAAGSC